MNQLDTHRLLLRFNQPLFELVQLKEAGVPSLPDGWEVPLRALGVEAHPHAPIPDVIDQIWLRAAQIAA